MKIKRGILIGLVLYFASLIINVILTITSKINLGQSQSISTTYWVIIIVTTVILTGLASIWYFNKANRNAKEGLKLGITFVIVGFIIDLLFFLTQSGGIQVMKEYYTNLSIYLVLILVVATCIFIGSRNNTHGRHTVKNPKMKSKSRKNKK